MADGFAGMYLILKLGFLVKSCTIFDKGSSFSGEVAMNRSLTFLFKAFFMVSERAKRAGSNLFHEVKISMLV